jgi:thiopeptide-type bacteriocin biosynthesis protein
MDRPGTPALVDILREFDPGDFFVLRAAACPIEVLQADPAHDDGDARLHEWIRDPFVQAAIYLASPTLSERVAACSGESSADFASLRPALFRYFVRMATRATPFGLMASFSTGSVGAAWNLQLGTRQALRRNSWFDLGFLYPLVRRVAKRPEARAALTFELNTTFFKHGDGWRYVALGDMQQRRERHLARVENSDVLEAIVAACSGGVAVTPQHLIDLVMQAAGDVDADDAAAFVDELIDAQILVATLTPALTGIDPVQHLLIHAENVPPLAAFQAEFRSAAERLAQIDRQEVDSLREAYAGLANSLQAHFGAEGERNLFHVDLRRDAPALSIDRSLLGCIAKAVGALHRISRPTWPHEELKRFREQFEERYGDREVDLLAALDEDSGIGFEVDPANRRNEGLLKDLRFPVEAQEPAVTPPLQRTRRLLRIIDRARAKGEIAYALDDADLEALSSGQRAPLPDVLTVFGSIGSGALERSAPDDPRFVLGYVAAGAGLFGRFCRADGALERHLKALLRKEEQLRPDAIFAEIVYLPEDRTGNIICRPAFRSKDIPYLGQSGLAASDRIPASDLALSVRDGRIVLRSRSLGREVLPRITCALNAHARNASVYRFLAALSEQDGQGSFGFSWGSLFEEVRFLPRIALGSVVVAPASWHIDPDEAQAWSKAPPNERRQRIADWRSERAVPQWIQIGQSDNLLSLNLEDAECVEALLDEVQRSKQYRIREMIPAPGELCVRSSEGRHVHEVMIPFVRRSSAARHVATAIDPPLLRGERRFVPGSRWLYVKLYGSAMATERALITDLYEWIRQREVAGDIGRWFFIRYRDTDDHLRVRFDAEPQVLDTVVRPKLERLCKDWSEAGAIWRVQFDTYEREVDRYGGAEAIEVAESIFQADSDLVAELLRTAPADAPGEWRWQIAMKVIDRYYQAFGHDVPARRQAAERSERAFRAEFRVDKDFDADLSRRYRTERALVEEIAGESVLLPSRLGWAQQPVAKFVDRLGPLAAWFGERAQRKSLTKSMGSIAASLAHMHVNRMMLANPREHEMIAYAFLSRAYRSRLARGSRTGQADLP